MNKAHADHDRRRVFYLKDPGYEKLQAHLGSLRDYFVDQEGAIFSAARYYHGTGSTAPGRCDS